MNPMASFPDMGSTGEAILFWVVAAFMVAGALGVLFFRRAAYAAISMVTVMLGLAVLYFALGAPFLGSVQVIVYTGAIMMLFLFVLMLIGVGASDEYQRQRRGNIIGAVLIALGLAVVLGGIIGHTTVGESVGLAGDPYSDDVITTLASTLFQDHWLSMQLAGTLLITAAIGAMLLTHTDRLGPKIDQHSTAEAKMEAFRRSDRRIGQLPAPGVFAQSDAVDAPAISGETQGPIEESIPRVLRVRGLERPISEIAPEVAQSLQVARSGREPDPLHGAEASESVGLSGAWGMPGPGAPEGLRQPPPHREEPSGPSGPAVVAGDESAHLDAGVPGSDHVSGPGEHAEHPATGAEHPDEPESASRPEDPKEEEK